MCFSFASYATFALFLERRTNRIHSMRNHWRLGMLVSLVLLAGCPSRHPANVRPVSLGIFEVIDCKTSGMAPMSLKGSTEKYCMAAKPVVDETDIRMAEASRDESGRPRLVLFF